jgi:hypothetical protein
LRDLIRGDQRLDATGRLEIYANAYFHRILGVLASDYAALRGALGAELFHDMVTSYLLVVPSRHPSLRYAGGQLAEFLSAHAAAAGIRARAPWASELAELEWARAEVFDALDGPLLLREALSGITPERLGALRLGLGCWVALRAFEYPVDRFWQTGLRGETVVAEAVPDSTSMVVWRRNEEVLHRRLEPREQQALDLVAGKVRFSELCDWAARQVGDAEAPAQAAGWLERWTADGLLCGSEARLTEG